MDEQEAKRMRKNLCKGLAWLAATALVVAVVEYAWDAATARFGEREPGEMGDEAVMPDEGLEYGDMVRFVFGDEDQAIGGSTLPEGFTRECFDPRGMGEVRCSIGGGVVGIVSDWEAADLYQMCADSLNGNGWVQMQSGWPLRSTFMKDSGKFRWAFLDVTQVAESGVAVIVTEEGA